MTDVSETEAIVGDASIVPEPEGADLPEGLVDSIELTEEVAEEIVEAEEKPLPRPFVPLHVHTHYSLLDGATRVKDIIAIAKESNMPAAAITDHGVMYGAVEFYNGAKAAGIKPIIGCDMYVTDGDITDRTARKPNFGLVLLAKDLVGYKNLVKMVSTSHLEGFYYKPRINWEILKTHSQGLIALSGDLAGPIGYYVMRGNMEAARERARSLKDIFGDDFYLEIFDHGKETETRFTLESLKISQELGIELVITNDSHFSRPGDQEMQKILLCMQTGKTLEENTRVQEIYGPEYYLKNGDELAERFAFLDPVVKEHALDNTLVVAEKCNLELEQGVSILPEFPLPEGQTPEEALLEVVNDHARQRYGEITPEIRQRLDYELGIINQMGFPAYFLITWDFINYARKNDIPVGPGRGSAAGSLVAFCLGITNIDPLEHNLLFERFLNPERVSMPDIDIDFCIERRDEVIQYVAQRYGRERVCQIGTFGTLAARAAVKAVA
ncbi:MAG: DNA polymerase III subunit alpha, partial [Vampirovibrio sp.]|nr:DNA polymerase III subunit alpha [Vampirovibrio sp.]